ncbi:UNVERIFIED_CONTAM: hypothetical protein PYX00_002607 [Menopon gallinae]|uniref:TIR domain-containing protein n=1 Tax=Menopon gallinae TaxID=328185 RepID=A0AAW2HWU0_9NEOP
MYVDRFLADAVDSQYQFECHLGEENYIRGSARAFSFLEFQCLEKTSPSDYDSLAGLRIGPVENVIIHLCPLPDRPISDVLSSFNTSSVKTFKFQSYRDLSNIFSRIRHLANLRNVTKLILSNNNLTELPNDFLRGFTDLTWLDLKENNLKLPNGFFESVPRLQVLELGGNGLTQIDPPLLSHLNELHLLNLWKNRLRKITRDVFSGLSSLEKLDISTNSIEFLPNDVFHDLKNLQQLSLHSNNFTKLPTGLLTENRKLQIFRLHDNHGSLRFAGGDFANLTELTEIHLMRNDIASIPEDVFWGASSVIAISLQGNSLEDLPQSLFRDQGKLQSLDLSKNLIRYLPNSIFTHLVNLKILRLGFNKMKTISRELFYGAYNLVSLEMERNELSHIDPESFSHLNHLEKARFSDNLLSFLPDGNDTGPEINYDVLFGNTSPFRNCISLQELYLANNSITEIFSDWRFNLNLRELDLSYNKIENLTTADVQFLGENIVVDLRHNLISLIELEQLENLALSQTKQEQTYWERNVSLLLEGNPFDCDCRSYVMFRYLERKLDRSVYRLVKLVPGDLKCHLPVRFAGMLVNEVVSSDLTCPVYDCPAGCSCSFRRHDLGLVVDCTASGLSEIPRALPNVTDSNHTELLLDGNGIRKLPNASYPGYERVTELHLSSNDIGDLGMGVLPKNLEVLTLDNNRLTALGSGIVRFLNESQDLRNLTLHNNPWNCNCSARELLDLIQQKFKAIPYLANVTCAKGREPLSKLSVADLCPVSMFVVASCIAAAVFGLLMGTLAALYYRYQREFKVWLYSHSLCMWFVTDEELDRDKIYDAFVSFSHKDENFVVNTLVPELESGENPFKLCLHYRDWIAGEWIPNQIARSVENSRRTLVVLSPNFLESVWSRMEFRAAHKQALSEGRARVIVVLYGDVGPTDNLDPELRAYISMNTYVRWGDPWFWGKLKYALPHPPSLAKNNFSFARKRPVKKERHIDDKLELIHTREPAGLPPGGTTPPVDGASSENSILSK